MTTYLIEKYRAVLCGPTPPYVRDPRLLMEEDGDIRIYYAPFDWGRVLGRLAATASKPGRSLPCFGAAGAQPWVSSTKASHGHLLGASGAIELAATIVSLTSGRIPPTRHLRNPDAAFGARLVSEQPATLLPGSAVLSNSFAFGGSNASVVATAA